MDVAQRSPTKRSASKHRDRQLQGPKAGEVLVEIKATGICHTDEFTRSGSDPRACSRRFRHEGRVRRAWCR